MPDQFYDVDSGSYRSEVNVRLFILHLRPDIASIPHDIKENKSVLAFSYNILLYT